MKKLTENIIEMSMLFSRMLENEKIKQPEPDTVSVFDIFKERVEDWANEFEGIYRDSVPYLEAIEIFSLHKFIEEGWAEVEDQTGDLEAFGYINGDMEYLSCLDAAYRFAIENRPVYLLYPDDTEAEADSLEAISKHQQNGGMFGYELPLVDIQFVMTDRFYEDGWAEPYLINARATKESKDVIPKLQEIANQIYKEDELSCGTEGIEQILEMYQKECPRVLHSFEFERMPGICYGRNTYSLE